MDTPRAHAPNTSECFLHVPFNQRWNPLEPVIKEYYVDQGHTLTDLAKYMKDLYRFDASERQYKYHLKKWDVGKTVPTSVKEEACTALGKRTRGATSTSTVEYNGERIGKAKLRRYMITLARQDNIVRLSQNLLPLEPTIQALKASKMNANDMASPFGQPTQTPSYISVTSPDTRYNDPTLTNALSPRNVQSPNDAPTPTMLAFRNKRLDDRAKLLIQGRHDELLDSMDKGERQIATTWLYQFWLFSYKTAKYWGRGPQDWSASVLCFTDFRDQQTTTNTPQAFGATPMNIFDDEEDIYEDSDEDLGQPRDQSEPPRLCFWSIHGIDDLDYVRDVPSPPPERIPDSEFEAIDEADWPDWPRDHQNFSFVEKLEAALRTNSFSNVDIDDLPLSLAQVSKSVEQSLDQLLVEALGFAIMARNELLLWDLIEDIELMDLSHLSPFHLAATYMSGAKTCCNVLDLVVRNFSGPNISQKLYINSLGHTVLDTLMMGILKSHTSCLPITVDEKMANDKRFAGEDLDVCGRWEADSPCIRKLLAEGNVLIPPDWKHMFCHTSAQSVCHSIGTLFGARFAPDINTPSGLFVKHCSCGRQLQLQPLHCLVMVAFHLSQSGRPEENLFGILACLVCLLVNGLNPLTPAHVSIDMLIGRGTDGICSHSRLDPLQLAEQILAGYMSDCTKDVKLGWLVFCKVMAIAQDERRNGQTRTIAQSQQYGRPSRLGIHFDDLAIEETYTGSTFGQNFGDESEADENDEEVWCPHHKTHANFYDGSKDLALLWGAIQTELLTYHKAEVSDAWISNNFVIASLLSGLENGFGVSLLPLVENDMMKPLCRCGRFREAYDEACAMVQEASAWYFSNTDIWDRATYIVIPEMRNELWYDY